MDKIQSDNLGNVSSNLEREVLFDKNGQAIPPLAKNLDGMQSQDTKSPLSGLSNPGMTSITVSEATKVTSKTAAQVYTIADVLPEKTVAVIGNTSQKFYRIRTFVKDIDGELRTLVILGERHIKGKQAFQQGDVITDCFKYRALEGVDLNKYWAGKALSFVIASFGFVKGKVFRNKNYQEGSTIDHARDEAKLGQTKDAMATAVAKVIEKHRLSEDNREGWNVIPALQIDNSTFSMSDVAGVTLRVGESEVKGEEILEQAFKIASSTGAEREKHELSIKDFPLEDDHKPTLMEQFGVAYLPMLLTANATYILCASILPEGPVVTPIKLITGAIGVAGAVSVLSAKLLAKPFYDAPWLPYLAAGPMGALVGSRNSTFVSNINEVFATQAEVDTLLAVVGRGHVPGMSKMLKEIHGWKELDVPGQKEGY